MARTRLRGLSIGDIQIGIEVPADCPWLWPDAPVADYQCLPREPEVHVGVRVAPLSSRDLGGERYTLGAFVFEVARRGRDWLLGLSRAGRRLQLAHFDAEFRLGEVMLSPETARARSYPLRGPIDEWIVLHRTVARGGLCLAGRAHAESGGAVLRLEQGAEGNVGRWVTPARSMLGERCLIVRAEEGTPRLFGAPWSDAIDPRLSDGAGVGAFEHCEPAPIGFRNVLDPDDAADLLVRHAILPLSDETLLERALRNARRIARMRPSVEVGRAGDPEPATRSWRSLQVPSPGPSVGGPA